MYFRNLYYEEAKKEYTIVLRKDELKVFDGST